MRWALLLLGAALVGCGAEARPSTAPAAAATARPAAAPAAATGADVRPSTAPAVAGRARPAAAPAVATGAEARPSTAPAVAARARPAAAPAVATGADARPPTAPAVAATARPAAASAAAAEGRVAPARATAVVGCAAGGATARPLPEGSVVRGPLALERVADNAGQPARAFAPTREWLRRIAASPRSTARERRLARRTLVRAHPDSYAVAEGIVRVAAGRTVTLAVAPEQRTRVSLAFSRRAHDRERPGLPGALRVVDGDAAVTFHACRSRATEFLGGYVVAGARCVRLVVSVAGRPPVRLRLPFGVRGCAVRAVAPATILRRAPYAGVACPRANSIACDRVGLAVWLGEPAAGVSARLEGRPVALGAAHLGGRPRTDWIGYLRPAGLLDGALRITPDRGRTHWEGAHPKRVRLVVDVLRRDGSAARTQTTVPLSSGWG